MPLISSLKVVTLKDLLRERKLSTVGTKAELVSRLITDVGSETIEDDEIDTNENLQSQISELRDMLENVISVIQQQANNTSTQQNQVRNNVENVVRDNVSNPTHDNVSEHINEPLQLNYREPRPRNTYSVKEIADTLPDYDPTKDQIFSVDQFIERVDKSIEAYNWDEKCLMLALFTKFKGPAKLWLDASAELYVKWPDLAAALREEFGVEPDEADIHFKMSNATRKPGESINEYCFRMSALGKRNYLSESAIIKYTREGLKHRELQVAIATVRFKSMKEMRATIDEYFSNMTSSSYNTKSAATYKRTDYVNKNGSKLNENNAKPQPERKPIICFNCSETGHISSACPKPQRKPRCKDCQRVHPKGTPVNCGQPIARNMNNVKKISTDKEVTVNGVVMFALIDTGSECSLIKRSKAAQIVGNRERCNVRISGVCGGTTVLKERIKATLNIDNIDLIIDLYVADDDTFSSDVIIGIDVFSNKNIRLICNDNGQRFEYRNVLQSKVTDRAGDIIKDIKCGEIDQETRFNLNELITEYSNVFGNEFNEIGLTDVVEMHIKLTTSEPIVSKPYRLPETKKESVRQLINELLSNDIIKKSTSEYASPIVLVKKKNGNDRLCVDYRRINQHTIKEIFPTPNIEERLQEVMKFKIFTVLDLNSGYYQVPIETSSQKYTAFVTPDGTYEFKRMPFGLKNAPAVFQRLMARIREDTQKDDVIHYMDDIVVGSNTIDEMLQKLRRVFQALRNLNLTISIKKCEFFKHTVEFLGHKIHSGSMSPGTVKTNAILEFPTPTNVREVRQFLGLSGYFRKFVPAYALVSAPLRDLIKKDAKFEWGNEQNEAFLSLKTSLTTSPVIVGYKTTAQHQIHTDASTIGLAGVLLQKEGEQWNPVAFYSRSTSSDERNYHSYELETLAVVESLERFRYYVYGKNVTVVTDCNAIKTTMQKKELIPRIARWWLRIQDFDMAVEHRSGQRMQHVDALSRAPYEKSRTLEPASLRISKTTVNEDDCLFSMQLQDDATLQIIEKLERADKETSQHFALRNKRLFRKVGDNFLWVVPKNLRWRIIQQHHDNVGHIGVEKTLIGIQKHFWFPRMRNAVKSYIKSCIDCAFNKIPGGKREGEYHYDNMTPIPFHTVHMDHLGPFPKSSKRNEHILVIVDAFTKFTIIKPVKNTATKHVINVLNEVSEYLGMPTRIVTDRGSSFTSHEFEKYCRNNDIQHILNAVRTPRANGHAERTNRTILNMLLPSTKEDKRWDEQLRRIQWSINSMRNSTTGKTPQQLLFGFEPRDILQNKLVLILHNSDVISNADLQTLRTTIADRIDLQRRKTKERYDQQHSPPKCYEEGNLVLVENEPASTGSSRKLEPRYKGPFIVTKVLDKDRYVVEDLPGSSRKQRHYKSTYASDKMKLWCSLPDFEVEYLSDKDDDINDEDEGSLPIEVD